MIQNGIGHLPSLFMIAAVENVDIIAVDVFTVAAFSKISCQSRNVSVGNILS